MLRDQLPASTEDDMRDIVARMHEHFGEVVRLWCQGMIVAALHGMASGRGRPGSLARA